MDRTLKLGSRSVVVLSALLQCLIPLPLCPSNFGDFFNRMKAILNIFFSIMGSELHIWIPLPV